jgi:hypothetical protein
VINPELTLPPADIRQQQHAPDDSKYHPQKSVLADPERRSSYIEDYKLRRLL